MEAEDRDDCGTSCCSLTFGSIFCCRPMRKNTRIKILWAWLLLLAVTSAVVLGCVVYSPFKLLATPTDMIPIQNHVHFLFCEEVNIISPGLQFNGYIMSGTLEIDDSKSQQYSQKTALFIKERVYEYFAFYFLERSKIALKHCSEDFLTFTVIIGKDNFEIWKKYQYCDNCYFDKRFLFAAGSCVSEEAYSDFVLETIVADEYFIIYSNDNFKDVWVDINIELDRAMYNFQNSTTVCTDSIQCDIILDGPEETPLIWVMDYNYNLGQYNHPQFSIKCVPRIWAYLLLHGFPVLFIGICLSMIIKKSCRNPETNNLNIQNERTPLLYNSAVLPPSYSTVFREPPKYEDVMRTCAPPPYCQVLAGSLETVDITHDLNENVSSDNIQAVQVEHTHVHDIEV